MPYPEQKQMIKDLVWNNHLALEDEPLLLAIYYASDLAPTQECLFEIARNFGYGGPDEDKEIFHIEFGASSNIDLPEGRLLRLSLTNPAEFRLAVKEGWAEIRDLQGAIARDRYRVIYQRSDDPDAKEAQVQLGLPSEKALVAA